MVVNSRDPALKIIPGPEFQAVIIGLFSEFRPLSPDQEGRLEAQFRVGNAHVGNLGSNGKVGIAKIHDRRQGRRKIEEIQGLLLPDPQIKHGGTEELDILNNLPFYMTIFLKASP